MELVASIPLIDIPLSMRVIASCIISSKDAADATDERST